MAIRAVLFDLGNTLVHYYQRSEFPSVLRRCLQGALRTAGVPEPGAVGDSLFDRALELNREAEDFAVRPLADRLRQLLPGFSDTPDESMDPVCRAFMAPIFACARLDSDAIHVFDQLRQRGVRTAVVSNTPWGSPAVYWREELDRHGLLGRADAVVFCVDVGWRKPHPAALRRALTDLDVEPDDAVFVGDDPRWDVDGARRAAVRPVLLSSVPGASLSACTVIHKLRSILGIVDAER